MALTPKQQQFAAEYAIDLNATQAAVRAGYSPRTARQQGSRLLSNADIQEAIQTGSAERARQTEIDAAYVLGRLKLEAEREDEDSSHSARVSALGLLAKHLGITPETIKHLHSGKVEVKGAVDVKSDLAAYTKAIGDFFRQLGVPDRRSVPADRPRQPVDPH